MGYFNRDNRDNKGGGGRSFGGNRSFGGKRSFGGNRGGQRPQMHDAVCSNCGAACKLPFTPTGDKPVYCRDCFAKMGGGEKRFERNDAPQRPAPRQFDAPRESTPSKAEFDALNAKLDKILALLSANAPKSTDDVAAVAQEAAPVEKEKRVSKKAEVTVQ